MRAELRSRFTPVFIIFMFKFLASQEENPGLGVTEESKKAGEMWTKIDSDTKEHFSEKARAAKEKYKVARLVLILMLNF